MFEAEHKKQTIEVRALPFLTPEQGRIDLTIDEGGSLAAIVAQAFPDASDSMLSQARVLIATPRGEMVIERQYWHRVRPHAGTMVIIRIIPAGEKFRTLLSVVVTVAAIALGAVFGGPLALALGYTSATAIQVAGAVISAGTLLLGTLAINALVPVQVPKEQRNPRANYEISGWRNPIAPDGVIPQVLGKIRMAPPFIMAPYSEVIDDRLYICGIFNFGYGPLELSGHRLGETPIEKFDGVQQRIRLGYAGNNEMNLFPHTVIEHPDAGGIELIRPLPRNGRGEVIEDEPSIATPVERTGAPDCRRMRLIFGCPAGMIRFKDNGDERGIKVEVRVQARLQGETDWEYDEEIDIWGKTREAFYRQHEFVIAERGTPEVRITRLTDERTDPQIIDRVVLVALQSIRPEYPIHFDPKLCLVGLRVRSSDQLNGMLDSYNAVASTVCLDWDHEEEEWTERETRNPASLCRLVHQGAANAEPTDDDDLDLASLVEFHDFCRVKGLRYDRVHDFEGSRDDALDMVAAAGRAIPRDDGIKWSVVIDRPQSQIVELLGPRNTMQVDGDITYIDPPDGFRVPFLDRTNDFASAERIVPWPGFSGMPTVLVQLDLPGKADPDEIWIEARRRQYEAIHRRETVTLIMENIGRMAVRGDQVALAHDVLGGVRVQARVKRREGAIIVLDEAIEMEEGEVYGIRFKKIDGGNIVGANYVRQVITDPGEHYAVEMIDDAVRPDEDSLILIGKLASVSELKIVQSVEPAEQDRVRLTLISPADLIDEYTDDEDVPPWTNRVGTSLSDPPDEPGTPEIMQVLHGLAGTDSKHGLQVQVKPDRDGDLKTIKIKLEHRLAADSDWSVYTLKDGERWAEIFAYSKGDPVQLRAYGVGPDGEEGPRTGIVDVTIGSLDDDIPADLDPETVSVIAMLGYVEIAGATVDDEATAWIQVYRNQTGTLDRETDAIGDPMPVKKRMTFLLRDGDTTRAQLLDRGKFESTNPWSWTGGWNITNARAVKTPGSGSAGVMSQYLDLVDSKKYRVKFRVRGRTAGQVRPRLAGSGSPASGAYVTGNGWFIDEIENTTGNDRFLFDADDDFDGAIEEVYLIKRGPASLEIGTYHYFLEPLNGQDVPGNALGPITVDVI